MTGKVVEVDAKGVKVELEGGVEAFIRANEATRDRVEDITTVISAGDSIEAKYTGVDRKSRVVNLSVRAKDEAEESAAIAQVNKQQEVEMPNAMAAAFQAAKGE
ncbi:30S ribosomal protein S1 [Actinobacillus equuli]|nr:30S ribosomal protein S1 [Actinobacillus equuli]